MSLHGQWFSRLLSWPFPAEPGATGEHILQPIAMTGPGDNLPMEVLEKVFWHLVSDVPLKSRGEISIWMQSVSSVCKRWRYVVLSNSEFWTSINIHNHRYAKIALRRARKDLPLDIYLSCSTPRFLGDFKTLKYISHTFGQRTRSITLKLPKDLMLKVLRRQDKPLTLQRLESLTLETLGDARDLVSAGSTPFETNLPIFSTEIPSLHHLQLRGVNVPWDSAIQFGLTHIEIRHQRWYPSLSNFISMLSRNPALRVLHLEDVGFFPNGPPIQSYRDDRTVVYLPLLEQLFFSGSAGSTARVLAHLRSPSTAVLRLSPFPYKYEHHDALESLYEVTELRLTSRPSDRSSRRIVVLGYCGMGHLLLELHSSQAHATETALSQEWDNNITSLLLLPTVTKIIVDRDFMYWWREVASSGRRIHTIEFRSARALQKFLAVYETEDRLGRRAHVLWPSLDTLHVTRLYVWATFVEDMETWMNRRRSRLLSQPRLLQLSSIDGLTTKQLHRLKEVFQMVSVLSADDDLEG